MTPEQVKFVLDLLMIKTRRVQLFELASIIADAQIMLYGNKHETYDAWQRIMEAAK